MSPWRLWEAEDYRWLALRKSAGVQAAIFLLMRRDDNLDDRLDRYGSNLAVHDAKTRLPDMFTSDLRQRFEDLSNALEYDRWKAKDMADGQAVLDEARAAVLDVAPYVPENFCESFLLAEMHASPELADAWNRRADSPAAAKWCENRVQKVFRKMVKAARATILDPKASEDRAMVSAAVRGSSGPPPPAPKTDYKSMTDQLFVSDTEKKFGFRPQLR